MKTPSQSILMVLEAKFPVQGGGGAESQVLSIGKCLLARGVQIEVVVPMAAGGPQLAYEVVEGLSVTRITYPKIKLLGGAVMLTKLAWLLLARRHHYSFIHAHIANNMAAVCAVVGVLLGKRVLIKLTGMQEMMGGILDPAPNIATRLKKIAIRRATLLQATSVRIRQMLIDSSFDPQRVLLLPNGVDVARFTTTARDQLLRERLCGNAQFVGVFVGRLSPEKGHESLFQAWASAFQGRDDVRLLLVGDGLLKESLMASAEQLGIGQQVVFAGHAPDVALFLAIADFGLLTSLSEGLSNALLEYMATGLPVVGSRVSGTEDFVIAGSTGWLFEPGSTNELASCLAEAVSVGVSSLRLMGRQAQQRIMDTASLDAVTSTLMLHYQFQSEDNALTAQNNARKSTTIA